MAKLSKMEISAIAASIYDGIFKSREEYNKKVEDDAFKIWFNSYSTTEDYKVLQKFSKLTKELARITGKLGYSYRFDGFNTDNILKDIFRISSKVEYKSNYNVSLNNIERDIIIAQAKNEDLDALIASLTEKYSK